MAYEAEEVISDFGNYYIDQGQNLARLVKRIYLPFETMAEFSPILTDDTRWRTTKGQLDRILQGFQKAFTPLGTMTRKPVEILNYRQKIDLLETPDDLVETFEGFLARTEEVDRGKWPFVRWLIEEYILPQRDEDYETGEIFDGVYAEPTPGTASAAGTNMDGINTIRKRHIEDERMVPLTLGAVPEDPSDFVDYVKEMCSLVGLRYKNKPMRLRMAPELASRYKDGLDLVYRSATNGGQNNKGTVVRNYENVSIVGLTSHAGSEVMWMTPADNAVYLQRKTLQRTPLMVQTVDRSVKIFGDSWLGVGFIEPAAVFTNDVDLPD